MDLSHPLASIMPNAHGPVLTVLARTHEPLSGRRIAELTDGRVSQRRANDILRELAVAGVVLCEDRPPSKLYRFNREHVAAPGLLSLIDMWGELLHRIRDEMTSWEIQPAAACLFGSAARGEGTTDSDLDMLLVRSAAGEAHADGPHWLAQLEQLVSHVRAWSGNECEILELSIGELDQAMRDDDRIVRDLRRDAIVMAGEDVRDLMRRGEPS
ncbi:nucleotidyltransferase domain-containing protein [Nocardioides sp.]|uniref:nucleotidyltransferase domain-containing protein n=1 Tax=Nocardioides sp. TaxID=35761 RepID=UPI00286CFF2F|nr:nucleotidyltransferase domain-containing protein [Nocardioides sp.]